MQNSEREMHRLFKQGISSLHTIMNITLQADIPGPLYSELQISERNILITSSSQQSVFFCADYTN